MRPFYLIRVFPTLVSICLFVNPNGRVCNVSQTSSSLTTTVPAETLHPLRSRCFLRYGRRQRGYGRGALTIGQRLIARQMARARPQGPEKLKSQSEREDPSAAAKISDPTRSSAAMLPSQRVALTR